jgi:CubicO group peptidase (beta-lactamase class C family)
MTSTRRDNPSDVITNRAALYEPLGGKLVNVPLVNPDLWNNGCGGLLSSVVDLAKWDAALYNDKFLSTSTREAIWTPGKFNNGKTQLYGFGWDIGELRGHRWVGHSGSRPGTSTQITRFLDDRLTVIVLINGRGNAFDIALHIAGMYLPGLTLSSIKPPRDPEPELTQRLKKCLFDLAQTRDSEFILPQVREEYAKSDGRIADLQKRLKQLMSFTYVSTEKALASAPDVLHGVTRACSYRMVSADDTRFYIFELTADNRVARLLSVAD